ncbi:Protein of unknown function [Vibrio xiamenensis]|uniref:Uncharacterized protein n=1 Tax=Vibrio xiamenensis TaxID=861298 RepID=A0A1G8DBC1_9VIBR|nr:DUF3237 domain-containing protein [Vibrio xiamenensis]SDH54689.1 Protein of unknown function [Vibrio xiamenensis]
MEPRLTLSFSVDIQVASPIVVSNSPTTGKRQLIPIQSGSVCGSIEGEVLPGGIDSQIIDPNGICRLSARYALKLSNGTVYIENNGIRTVPEAYRAMLFSDDMSFFSELEPQDIYFKAVPSFEVDTPELSWLTESIFVCSGRRTQDGVMLDFYQVN